MGYVYLAGSARGDGWQAEAAALLQDRGLDVFIPLAAWGGGTKGSGPAVSQINFLAVKFCSAVLARYDPEAYGTLMEIGYALALDHPVVICGENVEEVGKMLQHPLVHKRYVLSDGVLAVVVLLR
jgi:nucleoside 2-deoxyribosyltransferase